ARSDIFSLGVVLYEMIAGEPPFKGRTESHTRVSIIDHEPPSLAEKVPHVPRQLERIITKALAKDRSKRYQTITDFKLDLEQLRDELYIESSTGIGTRRDNEPTVATSAIRNAPTRTRSQLETVTDEATQVPTITSSGKHSSSIPRHSKWNLYFTFGFVV